MQHGTYFPSINHSCHFALQAVNIVKDKFLIRYGDQHLYVCMFSEAVACLMSLLIMHYTIDRQRTFAIVVRKISIFTGSNFT